MIDWRGPLKLPKFSTNKSPAIVVSETDVEAALEHLRNLPSSGAGALPTTGGRQHLLNLIREALGPSPKLNDFVGIAPGVWALVKPFAVDVARHGRDSPNEDRLQVWLLIRPARTDVHRIVELSSS